MNELIIKGQTTVLGKEMPVIYGGFDDNQRTILAKTVAELHGIELRAVNQNISRHLSDGYFEEGIDYVDLKKSITDSDRLLEIGFTKQSIANSENIYLLSQQGYSLLLKLMDTELARRQYKEVIRDYFRIKAESRSDSYTIEDPIERAKRWIQEQEEKKLLQAENVVMKPKALFADSVAASTTSILVADLAKILKKNGVEIGEIRLWKWMRDNGYAIKEKGRSHNMPTQRSMDLGVMEIKEGASIDAIGESHITKTTLVTGKGQVYFVNKFLKKEESV